MKTRLVTRSIGSFFTMSAPIALIIACGNTNNSEENSLAKNVTNLYDALDEISVSGNDQGMALTTSETGSKALATALLPVASSARVTYALSASATTWTPLLDSYPSPLTIESLQTRFRQSVNLDASAWSALAKNEVKVYVRIEAVDTSQVSVMGERINLPLALATKLTESAQDVTSVVSEIRTKGAFTLSGPSNALVLTPQSFAGLEVSVKRQGQAQFEALTPTLALGWANVWNNATNSFNFDTYDVKVRTVNGGLLYEQSSALGRVSEITIPNLKVDWLSVTPRVITDELQLEQFTLQSSTTEGIDLVQEISAALPRNVTYEFSFNEGANATPITGINLPRGVAWKTWFSFDEMKQILKANNLYTYHAWKVESINVRAREADANFKLASATTNREIWSFTTNKFELQTVAPELGNKRQYVMPSLANLKLTEYRDATAPHGYWLSEDYGTGQPTIIDRFLEKLATRLPVGPEIGALTEVVFLHFDSVDTAYGSEQKNITLNARDGDPGISKGRGVDKNADGTYTVNDFEAFTEIISEEMFEPFYHEYGHHLAFEYVNSDFINDDTKPYYTWVHRLLNIPGLPTYDEEFFNAFVKALNFDDDTKTNFPSQTANGYVATPVSNVYSRSDLFGPLIGAKHDLTGKTAQEVLNEHFKILREQYVLSETNKNYLAPLGPDKVSPDDSALMNYSQELIERFFSINEQMTIKHMLASMLYPQSNRDFYAANDGYMRFGQGQKIALLTEVHSKPFSEGVNKINYAPDYLFSTITNADGSTSVDASHANALMAAFHKLMGYTDRSALSHIWWKNDVVNDLRVINGQLTYRPPTQESTVSREEFSFGGYVENDSYKYIGYFDNGVFKSVPIFVEPFNLRAKTHITATSYAPADPTKLNYYYLTKTAVDTTWTNKPLYFSKDSLGTSVQALRGFNVKASSDMPGFQYASSTPNFRTIFGGENNEGQVILRIQTNTKIMNDPRD